MNTTVLSKPHKLRRVFVWQLPVRVYHWLNALSILVLIATGFFIGNPLAILSGKEASDLYIMGTVRFIHFVAAYIFFFNFAFRIYWGFVGNKYAGWKNFIPTNKQFFKDMWAVIKTDIFMTKGRCHKNGNQTCVRQGLFKCDLLQNKISISIKT